MTAGVMAARPRSGERMFFTAMAAWVLVANFLGFAPSYYLRFAMAPPHPLEPLTPLVFAHGLVFSAFILLFAAQTALVGAGRVDLHRRLGVAGFGLVAVMIPLAFAVGVGGIARPLTAPPGVPPLSWAAIPLLDLPVFGGLLIAALAKRRDPATHKRLMLCAIVDMLRPSLGRLLPMMGAQAPVPLLAPLVFLLPLIAWDLASLRRLHPATIVGTLVVALVTVLSPMIWSTPAWLAVAGWLAAR